MDKEKLVDFLEGLRGLQHPEGIPIAAVVYAAADRDAMRAALKERGMLVLAPELHPDMLLKDLVVQVRKGNGVALDVRTLPLRGGVYDGLAKLADNVFQAQLPGIPERRMLQPVSERGFVVLLVPAEAESEPMPAFVSSVCRLK